MLYIKKTIKCGSVIFVSEHPAPAKGKNKIRSPIVSPTTEKQGELNDKSAAKKLQWKILCNFTPHKDLFVTLTHTANTEEAEARKARKKFLREMREYHRKKGRDLRYIAITEKQGQWHHHLIMSDTPMEVIQSTWGDGAGRIHISPLNPYDNYQALAEYLVLPGKKAKTGKKQREKGKQRYSCSKNLAEPEIREKEIKRITKTEPKPPKGYRLGEWAIWADEYGELHKEYQCIWVGPGVPPDIKGRKGKRDG